MDCTTLAPDLPASRQILLCNLRLLGFDFLRFEVPNDSVKLGRLLRHPPKIAIVRLVSFLLGRLDRKRFSQFLEPLLIEYNCRVDVLVKNILLKWLKELPGNLKLTRSFSRFWSAPSETIIYQFLLSLSSYILQVTYKLEDLSNVSGQDNLTLTEEHVSSFLGCFEEIHTEQKKTEAFMSYSLSQSQLLKEELAHQAPCRKDCLEYLISQKTDSRMDDTALMNALSVYQEGEWKRLLALRQSVKASLTAWSRLSPTYLDFLMACDADPTGTDRCLKSAHFGLQSVPPTLLDYLTDQSVAKCLRPNGALDLPNFLRTVEALFRRLHVHLCRGTTESTPSASYQTETTGAHSSDILWCLNALRRAIQDSSATHKSVVSIDTSLPCAQANRNLSGEIPDCLSIEAADVSSTLTHLQQKLRDMIAQEEADWCPSPLTLGRACGLSVRNSVSHCSPSPQVSARPSLETLTLPSSPSTSNQGLLSPCQALSSSPLPARTTLGELSLNCSVSFGGCQSKVTPVEIRDRQANNLATPTGLPLKHSSAIESLMASLSFNASVEDEVVPDNENDRSLPGLTSTAHFKCSSQANSAAKGEPCSSPLLQFSPFGDRLSPTFKTAFRPKQARARSPVAGLDDIAGDFVRSVGDPSNLQLPLHFDSDSQCSELSLPSYLLPSSPLGLSPPQN